MALECGFFLLHCYLNHREHSESPLTALAIIGLSWNPASVSPTLKYKKYLIFTFLILILYHNRSGMKKDGWSLATHQFRTDLAQFPDLQRRKTKKKNRDFCRYYKFKQIKFVSDSFLQLIWQKETTNCPLKCLYKDIDRLLPKFGSYKKLKFSIKLDQKINLNFTSQMMQNDF